MVDGSNYLLSAIKYCAVIFLFLDFFIAAILSNFIDPRSIFIQYLTMESVGLFMILVFGIRTLESFASLSKKYMSALFLYLPIVFICFFVGVASYKIICSMYFNELTQHDVVMNFAAKRALDYTMLIGISVYIILYVVPFCLSWILLKIVRLGLIRSIKVAEEKQKALPVFLRYISYFSAGFAIISPKLYDLLLSLDWQNVLTSLGNTQLVSRLIN